MILNNKFTLIVTFLILFVLSACSSTPKEKSFGEKLVGQGAEVGKIGNNWTEGEELIADGAELIEDGEENIEDGESLIEDGESLISKGKSKVRKGESLIKKGNKMKAEAEEVYRLRDVSNKSQ